MPGRNRRDASGGSGSTLKYDSKRALDLLRRGTELPDAAFRSGQEEAIRHVVEGRGRLLVVQRTGWGKSVVYFIATRLLREAGEGPTLLVSPVLPLMQNQVSAAERMGLRAETISSDNTDTWGRIEQSIVRDEVDLLLISPERFGNQRFVERVLASMSSRTALLLIDEAHCISDWGHDFRPDYRRIDRIIGALPPNLRLLATTATANDRVVQDLEIVLGPDLTIWRHPLARSSAEQVPLKPDERALPGRSRRDPSGGSGGALKYDSERALDLLRRGTELPDAAFRSGQEEAIRHVVEGRGRLLVVQRTGWGKSFVYFIATRLLREAGEGPTLLVSPLLALMRNQIAAARRMGLRAKTINSDNTATWERIEQSIVRDEVDLLLISPERFGNQRFVERVLESVSSRISLLVIDEAHCISDWGHDFRPDYRRLDRIVGFLPQNLRLLATTATANDRVVKDLETVLGPDLAISRGPLARSSLALQTIRLATQAERLAWLAEQVPLMPGSGIVYTLTVRDAERVAEWLRGRGLAVEAYTGSTGESRPALEEALLDNDLKALVATSALGMGFDKPDLGFVVHYQAPGSVVTYYQQVGRAGRALESAHGVLLAGEEDTRITDFFINTAFPPRPQVDEVIAALEASPEGLTVPGILAKVNLRKGRLEQLMKVLSLESPAPVVKEGARWQLTAAELGAEFWQRADRLTTLRRHEQKEMQRYVDLESGHMEFLIRALDGDPQDAATTARNPLPATPERRTVLEAATFLKGSFHGIKPRKQGPQKTIPEDLRTQPGRALSRWNDAGWGGLVRKGKYETGRFSDQLVEACAATIRNWRPEPAPEWVTCIPSLRHPELVPDFTQRLAAELGLPFRPILVKTEDRPEQKTMQNSAQQVANVWGSLALDDQPSAAPVLLVDDIVDSRWTFTVAAWLLRKQGSGVVWPLALAQA